MLLKIINHLTPNTVVVRRRMEGIFKFNQYRIQGDKKVISPLKLFMIKKNWMKDLLDLLTLNTVIGKF